MQSHGQTTMKSAGGRFRLPKGMLLLALLLVVGTVVMGRVGSWHRHTLNLLRGHFLQKYGEIDVPEALDFDSMAVDVLLPVCLIGMALQLASALVFAFHWRGMGYLGGLAFWTLWLLAWGLLCFV